MNSDSLLTVIDSFQHAIKTDTGGSSFSLELLIAFVAVIFGPIIQLVIARISKKQLKEQIIQQTEIAKKQIHANTVTVNRQEWINTLRDTVAEYIAISNSIYFGGKYLYENPDDYLPKVEN